MGECITYGNFPYLVAALRMIVLVSGFANIANFLPPDHAAAADIAAAAAVGRRVGVADASGADAVDPPIVVLPPAASRVGPGADADADARAAAVATALDGGGGGRRRRQRREGRRVRSDDFIVVVVVQQEQVFFGPEYSLEKKIIG